MKNESDVEDFNNIIEGVNFNPKEEKKPLYVCEACKHNTYDESGILSLNLGGMPVVVCEKCRTIQLPEKIYQQLKDRLSSRIIT